MQVRHVLHEDMGRQLDARNVVLLTSLGKPALTVSLTMRWIIGE